jgi:hypothetical protein
MIIGYYEDTFLKSGSANERDSSDYQQVKKLSICEEASLDEVSRITSFR